MPSLEAKYIRPQPEQGDNERIPYVIDVAEWSESASGGAVTEVIDESDGSDVIATVMLPLAIPIVRREITLPLVRKLLAGRKYDVVVQFTGDNNSLMETHFRIRGI